MDDVRKAIIEQMARAMCAPWDPEDIIHMAPIGSQKRWMMHYVGAAAALSLLETSGVVVLPENSSGVSAANAPTYDWAEDAMHASVWRDKHHRVQQELRNALRRLGTLQEVLDAWKSEARKLSEVTFNVEVCDEVG